jgi:hypothetical protein
VAQGIPLANKMTLRHLALSFCFQEPLFNLSLRRLLDENDSAWRFRETAINTIAHCPLPTGYCLYFPVLFAFAGMLKAEQKESQ